MCYNSKMSISNKINFQEDIKHILKEGFIDGSDELMGNLIVEISELQERLYICSLFKSCYGIMEAIKGYNLEGGKIELIIQEHFSEYILTGLFSPPKNMEAYKIKDADSIINGYLSNVRFDGLIFDIINKKFEEINNAKILLNIKSFRDDYFSVLLDKKIISEIESLILNEELNKKLSIDVRSKI